MSPGLGKLVALSMFLGALVLGIADVISGFLETPDFLVAPPVSSTADALNLVSAIGAVIVAVGALGALVALVGSFRPGGADAGDDPWDGHTLEWATTSPPAPGNFAEPLAKVGSEAPLLDQRANEEETI